MGADLKKKKTAQVLFHFSALHYFIVLLPSLSPSPTTTPKLGVFVCSQMIKVKESKLSNQQAPSPLLLPSLLRSINVAQVNKFSQI